jgi:hypothetical protein
LADAYLVIAYYLRRQAEVEAYLRGRTQQADAARQRNEARTDPVGIRAAAQPTHDKASLTDAVAGCR